jgi:hypothetical protein
MASAKAAQNGLGHKAREVVSKRHKAFLKISAVGIPF